MVRSSFWRRLCCAAAVACLALGSAAAALAQTDSAETPPADTPAGPAEPLVAEAPYNAWKTHLVHRPEEAIVLVRLTGAVGAPDRTVTGLVVRCDGFILVPRPVRDDARGKGGRLTALIAPADTGAAAPSAAGGDARRPVVAAPALPHPGTQAAVPYALVKTTGYHVPCLPLLGSAVVRDGMPVRVLSAVPALDGAASPDTFTVSSRPMRVKGPGAARDTFALDLGGDAKDVPDGAIVVDDPGGAAVGVVTTGGTEPVFTTFARFNTVSCEVGVAPDRDAARLAGDDPGPTPDGMVWVPGGPARLTGDFHDSYVKSYRTDVVCTPGFFVEKDPVTRAQYEAWMSARPHNPPTAPIALHMTSLPRQPDLPASGMLPLDAGRYAADNGCRLLTDAEWTRASYVKDPDWIREKDRQANEMALRIYRALLKAAATAAKSAEDTVMAQLASSGTVRVRGGSLGGRGAGMAAGPATPVSLSAPDSPDFQELFRILDEAASGDQWPWRFVHPVGHYGEDKSVFGVRDVLTNPREYLQYTGAGAFYGDKPAAAVLDPDYTSLGQQAWGVRPTADAEGNVRYGLTPNAGPPQSAETPAIALLLWHDGWSDARPLADPILPGYIRTSTGSLSIGGTAVLPSRQSGPDGAVQIKVSGIAVEAHGKAYPIFRCAR